jgi:drug/metabolite transporter, DME family
MPNPSRREPLETASQRQEQAPPPGDSRLVGYLAVAGAAVLWAVAATVAKSLFEDGVEPLELTQARAFLSLLAFALLRPWRRPAKGKVSPWLIVALGLAITLVNAVYYIAIERLDVAIAIVIQYTAPALVVAWIAIGRRKMPAPNILAALTAAVVGVLLVVRPGSGSLADTDAVGLLAAAASAFLFAAYTLLSEKAEGAYGPEGAMFRAFFVASMFWIAFQSFQGWPSSLVDPDNVVRVLFVGLAGTFAPFFLYVWGLKHVRSERAVIAASLEPVAAALIAWVWFGETLSGIQIAGGVLVLAAVALLRERKPEP